MTDEGTDALEQALALHAEPSRIRLLRGRALPRSVLLLIRIAGGDVEAIAGAETRTSKTPQDIVDVAVFYIQQVMFHDNADSYRLLGLERDARAEMIKEHHRWLIHWLHPDRNPERWEVVYSEWVNRAWNSLNTEERRRDYDAKPVKLGSFQDLDTRRVRQHVVQRRVAAGHRIGSPRVNQRLPAVVIGLLAIVSMSGVGVFYWLQRDERAALAAASKMLVSEGALGDSAAADEAIRKRIEFDEHVIELSQPVLPAALPRVRQAISVPANATSPTYDTSELGSLSAFPSVARMTGSADPAPASQATVTTLSTSDSVAVRSSIVPQPTSESARNISPGLAQPAGKRIESARRFQNNGLAGRQSFDRETAPGDPPKDSQPQEKTLISARVTGDRASAGLARSDTIRPHAGASEGQFDTQRKAAATAPRAAPPLRVVATTSTRIAAATRDIAPSPSAPPEAVQVTASVTTQTGQRAIGAVSLRPNPASHGSVSAEHAVKIVASEFEDAYAKGNLAQMMRLFAPNAVNNRGGVSAIQEDYDRMFRDSSDRQLRLAELKWVIQVDRIAGMGPFEAQIRHNDGPVRRVRGWLEIEAVPIDGNWKIQRLIHRNAE